MAFVQTEKWTGSDSRTKAEARSPGLETGLRATFVASAALLGAIESWANQNAINPDGVSYLDIARQFAGGHWHAAITGMWSPLYSLVLALALAVTRVGTSNDYVVAHAVNFAVYLCSVASFELFLGELIRANEQSAEARLQPWLVRSIGYAIFLWCALRIINLSVVAPDLLVATAIYLACALLIRIRTRSAGWLSFLGFGWVLGFGYLAKAPILPIGLVFIGAAFWPARGKRLQIPELIATIAGFAVVVLPYVVVLSNAEGHLTFSEAGPVNYAWHVQGVAPYHWQGDPEGSGRPEHPTRQIHSAPTAFEFASPLPGTYPVWYDPSYWYKGLTSHFSFSAQLRAVRKNLVEYNAILLYLYPVALVWAFIAFKNRRKPLAGIDYRPVVWAALITLALFSLVHVEARYIAPFVAVLITVIFAVQRQVDKTLALAAAAVVLIILGGSMIPMFARNVLAAVRHHPDEYRQVAAELGKFGITSGDWIASTRNSNIANAKWAHLAGVRIVAEVCDNSDESWAANPKDEFWAATPAVRSNILQSFAATGASAVVADHAPPQAKEEHWLRIANTSYFIYLLRKPATEGYQVQAQPGTVAN